MEGAVERAQGCQGIATSRFPAGNAHANLPSGPAGRHRGTTAIGNVALVAEPGTGHHPQDGGARWRQWAMVGDERTGPIETRATVLTLAVLLDEPDSLDRERRLLHARDEIGGKG
jgi:hypothetical protein